MKFDLSINPENNTDEAAMGTAMILPGKSPEMQKPMYPEFTTQNEELANMLTAGQEVTATVRLKVTELRNTKGSSKDYMKDGSSVTFEIVELDAEGMDEAAPSMEGGKEEMDSYFKDKEGYDGPMEKEE